MQEDYLSVTKYHIGSAYTIPGIRDLPKKRQDANVLIYKLMMGEEKGKMSAFGTGACSGL